MRQAINKLLGLKPAAPNEPAPGVSVNAMSGDGHPAFASIEDNSDNGLRRQLVQVVLRDCLRRNGIPSRWMGCQIMMIDSHSRGPGLYVRLVLRHWDERLLRYAFAFEKQLRAAITQFEPQADTWLHGLSWELDLQSSCPYPDMPEAASWMSPVPVAAGSKNLPTPLTAQVDAQVDAQEEILQDLKDLERLFAARDVTSDFNPSAGADFQKTRPL